MTTYAGSLYSYGSSDGTGTAARFHNPQGVGIDSAGNLYVSDTTNNLIRKVAPGAVVTTLAGSGSAGSANGTGSAASFNSPIGITADSSGNVYVADYTNSLIRKISPTGVVTTLAGSGSQGYADGTGTSASFMLPTGLAIDGANTIYVADHSHMIRKIQ